MTRDVATGGALDARSTNMGALQIDRDGAQARQVSCLDAGRAALRRGLLTDGSMILVNGSIIVSSSDSFTHCPPVVLPTAPCCASSFVPSPSCRSVVPPHTFSRMSAPLLDVAASTQSRVDQGRTGPATARCEAEAVSCPRSWQ